MRKKISLKNEILQRKQKTLKCILAFIQLAGVSPQNVFWCFNIQLICYPKIYPSVSIASWCFTPNVFQCFYSQMVYHPKMCPSISIASWYITPKSTNFKMYSSISIVSCFGIPKCILAFLQLAGKLPANVFQHFFSQLAYHPKTLTLKCILAFLQLAGVSPQGH